LGAFILWPTRFFANGGIGMPILTFASEVGKTFSVAK
jgi:hypothetical protein